MQARLKGLERIARVYAAMKRAQAMSLEQAAAALHDAESRIEQQRSQVKRTRIAGREALDVGEHEAWKMNEAQNQLTERRTERLREVRRHREGSMFEAADGYRAATMQLEQMENVLRAVRSEKQAEVNRRAQREADDRFLAQRWWRGRTRGERG